MIVIDQNGRKASLYCDPATKGVYVTTDPNDTTPLPAEAVIAKALYVNENNKLIVAAE